MSVSFSNEVMEAMGFRQIAEGELVSATFTYVHVYAAQGLALSSPGPLLLSGKVGDHIYNVAVAASVNEACKTLVADDFAPDESAWSKEHRCSPPYALIAFGPTTEHICTSEHIKIETDGSITTYDGFPSARLELRTIESATLPPLLTALTCTFSSESQYVRFHPVDKAIAGITPAGVTVHDLQQIQVSGTAYVSTALPHDVVQTRLQGAADLASKVNTKVARFFQLALLEDDLLKRFLYFFLALEVETHAVFQSIDNAKYLSVLIQARSNARQSSIGLFKAHTERMSNLRDRFTWCAMCAWSNIGDGDVEEFKRLKDIRDRIAHGAVSEPPTEAVCSIELLTSKVLWQVA